MSPATVAARDGEKIVAFQDHCTHRGGPLADGVLACSVVTCPWHGSQFNVETGDVVSGPAEDRIRIFPVRVEQERIRLSAPEPNEEATVSERSGFLPSEPRRQQIERIAQRTAEKVAALTKAAGKDGKDGKG